MITAWRLRGTSQPPSDEHGPVNVAHDLHYSHIHRPCQVQMFYSGTCQGLEEAHKKARDKGEVGPKGPGDRPFMYPDKKSLSFAIAIRGRSPGKSLRVRDLFVHYILETVSYVTATTATQEHEASGTDLKALHC